jgi:hypothetical protein
MTRVFHCRPKVAMHHQRKLCAASTIASMGQPSEGMNGRCQAIASTGHPASRPMCSMTIDG